MGFDREGFGKPPEEAAGKRKLARLRNEEEVLLRDLIDLPSLNLYPLEYEYRERVLQTNLRKLREEISEIEGSS